MALTVLVIIAVLVPVFATLINLLGTARITERHHSHHDTYIVSSALTHLLVLAMTFIAGLGLVLTLLCAKGLSDVSPIVLMSFIDAFLVTCFLAWILLRRYRISTFDDCMAITPPWGANVWVRYEEIERMEWVGFRMGYGYRSLAVYVDGSCAVTLPGIVDLDQILMRIDRFDVLPHSF